MSLTPPSPQSGQPKLIDRAEGWSKQVGTIVGTATIVGTGVLAAVGILSDIYKFFLTSVTVGILSLVGLVLLYVFRYRRSGLMESVKVARYGWALLTVGWLIFLSLLALNGILLYFFDDALFDPVTANKNESAIAFEPGGKEMITVKTAVAVTVAEGDDAREPLSEPLKVVFHAEDKGKPAAESFPYSLTFDVAKKERFHYAKIEKVAVIVLSYLPLPRNLVFEEMMMTAFRPATEMKAVVGKDATTTHPVSFNASLINTSKPVTQRGSILLENNLPATFYVDVYFQQEGVYEIVPEITVSSGWTRRTTRPLKPVKVGCAVQRMDKLENREPVQRPEFIVPRPAPKGPAAVPKGPDDKQGKGKE